MSSRPVLWKRALPIWVAACLIVGVAAATDRSSQLSLTSGAGPGASPADLTAPDHALAPGTAAGMPNSRDGAPQIEPTTTAVASEPSRHRRAAASRSASSVTTDSGAPVDAPGTTATPAQPAQVSAPPAPDRDHIRFWGQVVDEVGRPVRGACVSLLRMLPIAPIPVVRTGADGTYVMTVSHALDDPARYTISVDSCPDNRLEVLLVMATPPNGGLFSSPRGDLRRHDLTMPLAPTTVDVDVVDPAGRPVLGVCVGWYDSFEGVGKHERVDDRGHVRIDRPGSRNTAIHMLGVCSSSTTCCGITRSHVQAKLTGGPNSIRLTVPWSAGDDLWQPLHTPMGWGASFDLVSLSTQPDELDPSCVGPFPRSRWYRMDSAPFLPGGTQLGGPISGGHISTNLQHGGTFAVWGLDGTGQIVEVGCAPAGTPIPLPYGGYHSVTIQVIPAGELAQTGNFSWNMR